MTLNTIGKYYVHPMMDIQIEHSEKGVRVQNEKCNKTQPRSLFCLSRWETLPAGYSWEQNGTTLFDEQNSLKYTYKHSDS